MDVKKLFHDQVEKLIPNSKEVGMKKGIRLAQKYVSEAFNPFFDGRNAMVTTLCDAEEDRMNNIKQDDRRGIVDTMSACIAILGGIEREVRKHGRSK